MGKKCKTNKHSITKCDSAIKNTNEEIIKKKITRQNTHLDKGGQEGRL